MSHIDPKKLAAEIEEAERHLFAWPHASWRPTLQLLKEAARAHLATLPRYKEVEIEQYATIDVSDGRVVGVFDKEADAHGYTLGVTQTRAVIRLTGTAKVRA